MNIGKAIVIFLDLNSSKYTTEEKAMAIYQVVNMPTHMSIRKSELITAVLWLWHQFFEFEEQEEAKPQTNFDRIKAMTIEEMAVMLAVEIPHGDCYGCELCHGVNPPHRLGDGCQDGWLNWLESEVTDDA